MKLDIVYENNDLLIVNKPRGMVTHHGAGVTSGTLQDLLEEYNGAGLDRAGIVHRLDKNTSGLLVVAKNAATQERLSQMFRDRRVKRTYIGIVEGIIHTNGTINKNLIRSPRQRTKYITTKQGGREAITHYEVIEAFKRHTLVRFNLETGRTHQIRVHCKSIGHPLVGDIEYNPKSSIKMHGQMLESVAIAFDDINVEIKPSQIFVDCLNKL